MCTIRHCVSRMPESIRLNSLPNPRDYYRIALAKSFSELQLYAGLPGNTCSSSVCIATHDICCATVTCTCRFRCEFQPHSHWMSECLANNNADAFRKKGSEKVNAFRRCITLLNNTAKHITPPSTSLLT